MTPTVPLCRFSCVHGWACVCLCSHVCRPGFVVQCRPSFSTLQLLCPGRIFPESSAEAVSLTASQCHISCLFPLHSDDGLAVSSTQPFTWVLGRRQKSQKQTLYLLDCLSRECCLPLVKAKLRLGVREVDFVCVPP